MLKAFLNLLPHVFAFVGMFLSNESARFPGNDAAGHMFYGGYVLLGGSQAFLLWRRRKSAEVENMYRKATKELATLRGTLDTFFDGYLAELAILMNLNVDDRISLYRHVGNGFYRVGRFSPRMQFRVSGRRACPSQGVLEAAWDASESLLVRLPDFATHPQQYIDRMMAMGVPADTVRNLSMKSRGYWAIRIQQNHTQPVGVLVVESLRTNRIRRRAWRQTVITAAEVAKLATLMHNTSSLLPSTEELNELLK